MTEVIDGTTVVGFTPIVIKGDTGAAGTPGAAGATGAVPNISAGTVTTLPAGSAASASITGTPSNPVLNLQIPQGAQGIPGTGGGGAGTVTQVAGVNPDGAGHVTLTPGSIGAATDSAVVHNTGVETIAGVKTFSSAPVVPAASFPESAVTNLSTDLAAKLASASNLSDVANAATARTNLGLGTAATQASTAFDSAGAASTAQTAAQAYADANKVPLPTAPVMNPGQLLGTDVNGNWSPLNHQLAYSEDLSGTATVIPTTGATADVYGIVIDVPATPRNVMIRWGGAAQITAAGAGAIYIGLYEITSGSAVAVASTNLVGGFLAGTGSAFPVFPPGFLNLGPVASPRQFKLSTLMARDAASALTASVRSTSGGNPRTWLEAVAQ